ncbi:MAG: ActS/PrrB/RegB family redox-sensitive histidine kinase [Alphaproteobacteria bacterium]|nr:ActS/PrrB/RegB family redox-sensitive histidine kinase [Alphaproteobacteria bacterium]
MKSQSAAPQSTTAAVAGGARGGRVRVRTLVVIRWIALAGQVTTLLVVSEALAAPVPMTVAMALIAISALLNAWLGIRQRRQAWHSEREALLFLGYDVVQVSALLFLTGGLANPFAMLILVPVTVSATILRLASTLSLAAFSVAAVSLLAEVHAPLPWAGGSLVLPRVYMLGVWIALVLGMGFIVFFVYRVAQEARRMQDALSATQLSLARQQELSSLGALAAAAAHELGTPLSTIQLVTKELAREFPQDSETGADIRLLGSQAQRCREILARLARNPGDSGDTTFDRLPLGVLLQTVAEPYRREGVAVRIKVDSEPGQAPPLLTRTPELKQGLGNLVANAIEFARAEVAIDGRWSNAGLSLEILDDGPGFSSEILDRLGEPYVTSRPGRGGMGLGVFIAKTLLERTGATVGFANRRRGRGARVSIVWPPAALAAA